MMTGMGGNFGQDFPTLRLNSREDEERRPYRDVPAGFRGCRAARVPAPFPAPDDPFWMSGGVPAGPGRFGVSGQGPGGDGDTAVQLQPAPGSGEALRVAAVGKDHREREVVRRSGTRTRSQRVPPNPALRSSRTRTPPMPSWEVPKNAPVTRPASPPDWTNVLPLTVTW